MHIREIVLAFIVVVAAASVIRAAEPPASQPAKTQPVDFRKLKEIMPAELLGQKRTRLEGEKVSVGDFVISQATASYGDESKEDAPRIELQIVDYSANQPMVDAMSAWKNMEIDKEGDDGFERTTKINDQPAFESFQKEGKSGQVNIVVAGRYIVTVQLNNVTGDDVKKVGEGVPVKKLAELK